MIAMQDGTSRPPPLSRPIVRGVIAAALLAAMLGGILVWQAAGGDSSDADPTTEGRPTVRPADLAGTATPEPGLGALDDQPPVIGQAAPQFVLRDLEGNRVSLGDYRGQVVWINFWATWCRPCKKELPDIQKLYDEKRGAGLVVLTVNAEESADDARSFMERASLTLPVVLDSSGSVYRQYRLQGLPDSFFVGRDGNLAALQYGYMTEKKMRERLAQAGIE